MDVRIAAIKDFETAPGSPVTPGTVLVLPERIAELLVTQKKAVYYSDFSVSMIQKVEEIAAEEVKPSKARAWTKRK